MFGFKKKYSYSHQCNTMLALEHYMELKYNPITITRPRKPKRLFKEFLTEAEVSRMIVESGSCIRKKAIVTVLAYSGIRNVELCRLKVKDVDLGENKIFVRGGKNKKDRMTNISSECTKVLISYLKNFPREDEEYMFTTLRKGNQIASADIRKHIKLIAKRARVDKRVYPHLYRRSLASNMLSRGANVILIKNQLGHVFVYVPTLVMFPDLSR